MQIGTLQDEEEENTNSTAEETLESLSRTALGMSVSCGVSVHSLNHGHKTDVSISFCFTLQ